VADIVISSGHGKYIRGAEGPEPWGLDEVDCARETVDKVAELLRGAGVNVITYHDDVSKSQNENLERIVAFHNQQVRRLDVSVHLNANQVTSKPMGSECWYVSQQELARDLADGMATALGLPDRGPKYSSSLYFLNHTAQPAVLLELCFVDSEADARAYDDHWLDMCKAIASMLAGEPIDEAPGEPPSAGEGTLYARGTVSWFGGPEDDGVSPSEDLAWIEQMSDENKFLFLPEQPSGTTGMARRLNPAVPYVACRWNYDSTPKTMLANPHVQALVRNPHNGREARAWPADWGPHEEQTGRAADISPGLMQLLDVQTDDIVEVFYPAPPWSNPDD
jgi:N-acetylmuramoyl-L-alanine amidase